MLKGNVKFIMEWMARRGLLHNTHTHTYTHTHTHTHARTHARMHTRTNTHMPAVCERAIEAHRDAKDGYCWKCRQCRRREGVRSNSFSKSKIALGKLMLFLFSWASEIPSHNGEWHLPISRKTSVDWANFPRDVCAHSTRWFRQQRRPNCCRHRRQEGPRWTIN